MAASSFLALLDDIAATLDDARAAQTSFLALFLVTDGAASDPGTIGLAPVGDAVVVTFGVAADQVEVQFGDAGPTATVIDEFGQATPPIETDQWVSLADAAVRSGDDGAAVLATAEVPADILPGDNIRRRVVSVRKNMRFLLVDGEPEHEHYRGETDFLAAALMPPGKVASGIEP